MEVYSADDFWQRYKDLTEKDLPIILKTNIKQSTLSTWKVKNVFPRADQAVKIAGALNTSVEYLVTGKEKVYSAYSTAALEIAIAADKLNEEGKKTVLSVVKGLETQFPVSSH